MVVACIGNLGLTVYTIDACVLVTWSCTTLSDPIACQVSCPWDSPARILEWIAIYFSRGFSWLRDQTQVSCIAGRFFTIWAIGKFIKLDNLWEPTVYQRELRSVLCGDLNGKEIQKRGDLCMHKADSLFCIVEINTTLQGNYTPIKIVKKEICRC